MEDEVLKEYIYTIFDKPYCFLCEHCIRKHTLAIEEPYCLLKKKYVPEFSMGNELCFEHKWGLLENIPGEYSPGINY
jgi:hypothetical protein